MSRAAASSTAGSRQHGVALITVLLIVFLATAAAASLASLEQYAVRRSTLLQHQQQARLYALGAEQWARLILLRDLRNDLEDNRRVDSLDEDWAVTTPALPVEGGFIRGRIQDMQSCFNLNNLLRTRNRAQNAADPAQQRNPPRARRGGAGADQNQNADENAAPEQEENADARQAEADKENNDAAEEDKDDKDDKDNKEGGATEGKRANRAQVRIFNRLLTQLELEPTLSDAILDWLDSDQDQRDNGAEDGEYAGHEPPYATADRLLTSVTELRLIKGVDRAVYNKLAPYVCVLPSDTKLNVNTASPMVLAALADNQEADQFAKDKQDEKKDVYESVDDFLQQNRALQGQNVTNLLAVNSNFFRVDIESQVGEGRALLHSILQRTENGEIRVLYRSFSNEL